MGVLLVPWSWKSRAIPLPTPWATPEITLSLLYGGGWSTPCPGHFSPGKDMVPTV